MARLLGIFFGVALEEGGFYQKRLSKGRKNLTLHRSPSADATLAITLRRMHEMPGERRAVSG
jgi:hypothetical protein